jgi:hypothetical protein
MLIAADDALMYAAKAGDTISEEVDKKFGKAIHLLSGSEKDFSSKDLTSDPNIGGTITREANLNDKFDLSKYALATLCALKRNLHAKVKFPSFLFLSTLTILANGQIADLEANKGS